MLTVDIMPAARTTPAITDIAVSLAPIFRKLAPKVPVQAPVPGMGMPTKSISASIRPSLPALPANISPQVSKFPSRQI